MNKEIFNKINNIPIWKGDIEITNLEGGITNRNYLVKDDIKKYVVRLGEDILEHLISRSNELIVSKAASMCGISPKVIYNDMGILVLDFIESKTLTPEDVKKKILEIILILKKIHYKIPDKLYGQSFIFWVFHVIRNYSKFLQDNKSIHSKLLFELLKKSKKLENASAPHEIVFGHNDLLAANFLDDGSRIWVIDWEYGGYNSPLFDLGGLSSNNNFNLKDDVFLLENYYEKKINEKILLQFKAMKCSSLLRETMWSMVSEITSKIKFDYSRYTEENIDKFNKNYNSLEL